MNRYERAFHSSPSPMALSSLADGVLVEVNRAFVELTGFTVGEAVGKNAVELGLLDEKTNRRIMDTLLREGRFRFLEVTAGTKSGSKPALLSGEVLDLDDGPHLLFVGTDLTQQKEVENLLRFTQFSVDRAGIQVFWANPQGRLTYANDLAAQTLGYAKVELLSLSVFDVDAEITAETWPGFWEGLREGAGLRFLSHHRTKGGITYPVEVSANHLEVGGRETVVGFVRDLSDLQRIQAALEETETKFRAIFDQGVELMGVLDLDGTLLDVNAAALRMIGATKDHLVGKAFWDTPWWSHSSDLQRELKGWIQEAAGGKAVVLEAQHPSAEGGWRTVEASIAPIRDLNGEPRYLLAVGHDVTDRVKAAAALRESEERYETLVANIPDVTWITNRQGMTTFVSPNVKDVVGFSREELCDSDLSIWFSRLHPQDAEKVTAAFDRLFSHGESFDLEYRFKRKDGTWVWLQDRAVRAFEEGGQQLAYGVFSDVTHRRSLEVQLQQAQKLDTLGVIASGIAHDFNNLLVPLLGYADLLRDGVDSENPLRKELESHVFHAVDRARDLVRQILTFSRGDEPERKAIHLVGPLKTALRLVGATIPTSVVLRQRFGEEGGRALADGNQMQQVILNLCTNGIQAMGEEGGVLEVVLEGRLLDEPFRARHPNFSGDHAAVIEVRDTGVGMDPEVLERVFDPFFTTKKVGEGTGLGLSIAYGIIKSHGGVIEGESELGKGTVFRVYLPTVGDPDDEPRSRNLDDARGSESILFIDDQEAVRETGRRLLAVLGYETTLAEGGREALRMVREDPFRFDVVVSDYDMPEMTGTHLALELMEIRPDLPIVLITGSHPARVLEGVGLGVRGSLIKPFTAGELGRAIRRALAPPEAPGEG